MGRDGGREVYPRLRNQRVVPHWGRREESCKNREVHPTQPTADSGGQVSGSARQEEHRRKKEGKRNLTAVSEFIRLLSQRWPLASPVCPRPCKGGTTCQPLHHPSCIVAAIAVGLRGFA